MGCCTTWAHPQPASASSSVLGHWCWVWRSAPKNCQQTMIEDAEKLCALCWFFFVEGKYILKKTWLNGEPGVPTCKVLRNINIFYFTLHYWTFALKWVNRLLKDKSGWHHFEWSKHVKTMPHYLFHYVARSRMFHNIIRTSNILWWSCFIIFSSRLSIHTGQFNKKLPTAPNSPKIKLSSLAWRLFYGCNSSVWIASSSSKVTHLVNNGDTSPTFWHC